MRETATIYVQNQWASIRTIAAFGKELATHPIDTAKALWCNAEAGLEVARNLTPEKVFESVRNCIDSVKENDAVTLSTHVAADAFPGIDKLTKFLRIASPKEKQVFLKGNPKGNPVSKEIGGKTSKMPEGHIWDSGSPFKRKTADELNDMFAKKGFDPKGPDPKNGLGSI